MTDSCKFENVEDLFDIGKFSGGVKLRLTWGLYVPVSCRSQDVEDLFDVGNYTGGVKLKLIWGLSVPDICKSKVCLI